MSAVTLLTELTLPRKFLPETNFTAVDQVEVTLFPYRSTNMIHISGKTHPRTRFKFKSLHNFENHSSPTAYERWT